MIKLTYLEGGEEKLFDSSKPQFLIGRPKPGRPVDLDLSPAQSVSRPHARISLESGRYWIEDLESRRGTRLNGEAIQGQGKRELRAGDVVAVGDVSLRIESASSADRPVESNAMAKDSTLPPEPQNLDPPVTIGATLDSKVSSAFELEPGASDSDRRLALLYELPLRFAKEARLDSLMQRIVEGLVKVVPGAARGALLLAVPQSRELILKAHLPVGEPAVSMTLARRAVARREGFIWELNEEDATSSVLRHGIGTGMYAPLIWREEVVGVLCVDNPKRERMFAKDDLRLLLAVAHYAAMAVAHQRALNDLTRHSVLMSRLFSSRFPPDVRERLTAAAMSGSMPMGMRQSHVTVLIADIRGFTQTTARLGGPRMGDLLNEYFTILIEAIQANGGTIERFAGDAIFAVFGSPEDDPGQHEHAVCAAIEMQAAVEAANKSRLKRHAEICEAGIGIDCGEVLHGFIGNAERLEYTVIGDAANLAARYSNGAAKGEILISQDFHARVFNKVRSERIEIQTKHEGVVPAFRVKGLIC